VYLFVSEDTLYSRKNASNFYFSIFSFIKELYLVLIGVKIENFPTFLNNWEMADFFAKPVFVEIDFLILIQKQITLSTNFHLMFI